MIQLNVVLFANEEVLEQDPDAVAELWVEAATRLVRLSIKDRYGKTEPE